MKKQWLKLSTLGVVLFSLLSGCGTPQDKHLTEKATQTSVSKVKVDKAKEEAAKKEAEEKKAQEEQAQKEAEEKKKQEEARLVAEKKAQEEEEARKKAEAEKKAAEEAAKKETENLASLEYQGVQTIEINGNVPTFSDADLSIDSGAWEQYGDLDNLNRVTQANAMLNQSLMPTGERGDISSVTPTGWKNKRISSGYLYNRSHLIGFALAGENANWKNLMTGTRQLNAPEMLRFEMDLKYYLEQDTNRYVRYQVTPIFRGDELLARGVHLMAQSIGDNGISFNVYIFNIQDGVILNYADGSSNVEAVEPTPAPEPAPQAAAPQQQAPQEGQVYVTPTGKRYHSRPHGNGNFTPAPLSEATARGLTPCQVCY